MYVGLSMFWSIFAGQFGFGRFWLEKLVLVDLAKKKWFWSILAGKTGRPSRTARAPTLAAERP